MCMQSLQRYSCAVLVVLLLPPAFRVSPLLHSTQLRVVVLRVRHSQVLHSTLDFSVSATSLFSSLSSCLDLLACPPWSWRVVVSWLTIHGSYVLLVSSLWNLWHHRLRLVTTIHARRWMTRA